MQVGGCRMWHEARRQEKMLRAKMVDCSKRAERRRKYYENIRKDPEQFMQVHGRRSMIHTDRSISKAAEDHNVLRPWLGDTSNMIDRFDARSHLDAVPTKDEAHESTSKEIADEKEELVCEFERYRVLIINEYKGVTEKNYLRKIAEREFWLADEVRRTEQDKKKKAADAKASIGYAYEDSDVVKGRSKPETDDVESDDEIPEPEDIDVELETTRLDAESQRRVNNIGAEFGVCRSLFVSMLRADQQAQRDHQQLKYIERQKAALAGRDAKHERMLLRKQRAAIVGKGCQDGGGATTTLLSFIENKKKKKLLMDDADSSSSNSETDNNAKAEFITTFGGDEQKFSDDEPQTGGQELGPQLPTDEFRQVYKLNKRENTPDFVEWDAKAIATQTSKNGATSKSRTTTTMRKRSPSRSRSRSRDRQRRRRSRSRSRERRRKRSRSESHRRRRHSSSRSSSRSCSRSSSKSSSVRPKVADASDRARSDESGAEKKVGDSAKTDSSSSESEQEEQMMEIRSSMSESEKERIEIENRKRRVRLTKKMVKKNGTKKSAQSDDDEVEKKEITRKIRQKMKKALRNTREELQRELEEKRREAAKEKRVRDELVYIEEQERREREREKRRREDDLRRRDRRRRSGSRDRSRSRERHSDKSRDRQSRR